jgi:hypothetical protein
MKVRYGEDVEGVPAYSVLGGTLRRIRRILAVLLLALLILIAGTVFLDSVPPLWWDEGWTVSVARNWVELGHYGRLKNGELAPRGLEAGFPLTATVALAFKYLGIGLFQARLVAVAYLFGALALLFYLACRFYNRRVAIGTLLVLLLMSGSRYVHPVFMGRQVLGEAPALFFLLAGFVCLLWAEERSRIFLFGSVLFWSLAIITKAQVLPFWAMSLVVPLAISLFRRQWPQASMFAATLVGSVLLGYFWLALISRYIPASSPVSGLYLVIGLVLDPFSRLLTFIRTLQIGLPTLLGLVWALNKLRTGQAWQSHQGAVMLALFVLGGSWFAWWELASTGWPRYLFPSAFLASIFVSAMLYEWTNGFRVRAALRNLSAETRLSKLRLAAALFLVGWASIQTVSDLAEAFVGKSNQPLLDTVAYLHDQTPASAIVETYESELLFFLNRRYHYPPDQVHVELIRREDLSEAAVINYDPLAADPDYLVIGGWCRYYKCYDNVLNRSNFKLVKAFGPYEVFQRVREAVRP